MNKFFVAYIFFSVSLMSYSQKPIQDTIIDSATFHYAHYRINGKKLKAFSENQNKRDGGYWIYFSRKGDQIFFGEYNKNGKREGHWWFNQHEWIEYRNGKKTGRKGVGCLSCSPF